MENTTKPCCHFCWSLPLLLFVHVIAAPIVVGDDDYTKIHGNMKIEEVEIQKTNQQIKKCMQRKQIINKGCMFFLEGGMVFCFSVWGVCPCFSLQFGTKTSTLLNFGIKSAICTVH